MRLSLDEIVEELAEKTNEEKEEFVRIHKIGNIKELSIEILNTMKAIKTCEETEIPRKLQKKADKLLLSLKNKLEILRIIEEEQENKKLKKEFIVTRENLKEIDFSDEEVLFINSLIGSASEHNQMFPYFMNLLREKLKGYDNVKITFGELSEIHWKSPLRVGKVRRIDFNKLEEISSYDEKPWLNIDSFCYPEGARVA